MYNIKRDIISALNMLKMYSDFPDTEMVDKYKEYYKQKAETLTTLINFAITLDYIVNVLYKDTEYMNINQLSQDTIEFMKYYIKCEKELNKDV